MFKLFQSEIALVRDFKEAKGSKISIQVKKHEFVPTLSGTDIDKLKDAVLQIVKYFYDHSCSKVNEYNDPTIGALVRNTLAPAMHGLLCNGLKSNLFSKASYWKWIEACSQSLDGNQYVFNITQPIFYRICQRLCLHSCPICTCHDKANRAARTTFAR